MRTRWFHKPTRNKKHTPRRGIRKQETGNRKQETNRYRKQETGHQSRNQEPEARKRTGNRKQETRNRKQETGNRKQETRMIKKAKRDKIKKKRNNSWKSKSVREHDCEKREWKKKDKERRDTLPFCAIGLYRSRKPFFRASLSDLFWWAKANRKTLKTWQILSLCAPHSVMKRSRHRRIQSVARRIPLSYALENEWENERAKKRMQRSARS